MSKRVEAQTGNISINPITGVVELYNVDALIAQTTTTGAGGFLVDKGAGLEQIAVLSEITGVITTTSPLSVRADINTATPPTNEAVTGLLRFRDLADDDTLGSIGYTASSVLQITNNMQGSNMEFVTENAAGTAQTLITIDPDLESIIFPTSNDVTSPTLAFGDGDTGFLEASDDSMRVAVGGALQWIWSVGSFVSSATNGVGLLVADPTGTAPNIVPDKLDADTGIGHAAADQLSLVSGGVEMLRLAETGVVTTDQVIVSPGATLRGTAATPLLAFGDGDTGFYESNDDILVVSVGGGGNFRFQSSQFIGASSGAAYIQASAGAVGAPTYAINADTDTGMFSPGADIIALTAGGVEMIRAVETGVAGTDQVIISSGATLRGAAATPLLAFGDGDTGFYESLDDTLVVSLGGTAQWDFASSAFQGTQASRPALQNEVASTTNPTLVPHKANAATGIGGDGANILSFISNGVEVGRVDSGNDRFVTNAPFFIQEQASAGADVTAYGQLWVRTDAPNTLMYTDDIGNDFTANNVLEIEYAYSSATASADPGAGTVRFNSVTIGSISEAYFDDADNTGRDNSIVLANLAVGDLITFRSATDPADYFIASVNGATTDNGGTGWWTVPVTPVYTGTIFTNGDLMRVSVEWQSQAIAGSGNVSASATPVNNQVAVWTDATTIEGDANFTWDGSHLVLGVTPPGSAATPTLAFGDGDSGIYESADDAIAFSTGGTQRIAFNTEFFSLIPIKILEQASANADTANYGQVWVQTETPNRLMFTDDIGQDIRISPNRATVQTTDATVTEIESIAVASGTGFGFEIHIIGTQDATGDTVFERIFGAIRNQGGITALVGSTIVDRTDDAGATTWTITVAADDATDALTIDVTGEAAHTIDWKCSVNILDV